MASIVWLDLDGNRHESDEYNDIKSFGLYIFKNKDNIEIVESLDCDPLDSLYDESTLSGLFDHCENLIKVEKVIGTSGVTNMCGMFNGCYNLKSVPYFDTSNVGQMGKMFQGCIILESVPLFDTFNVEHMGCMFDGCDKLKSVPLFDTSKVEDMRRMFYGCSSLESVPLFNTSNVVKREFMFSGCDNLKSYTLPCDEYNTRSLAIKTYEDFKKSKELLEELDKLWQV